MNVLTLTECLSQSGVFVNECANTYGVFVSLSGVFVNECVNTYGVVVSQNGVFVMNVLTLTECLCHRVECL